MAKNDFEKQMRDQAKLFDLVDKSTKSAKLYSSETLKAYKLTKLIADQEAKLNKLRNDTNKKFNEADRLRKKINQSNYNATAQEKANLKVLDDELENLNNQVRYYDNLITSQKKQSQLINKNLFSLRAVSNVIKNEIGVGLKAGWKTLMEYDKAVRKTQLSMGILSNQSGGFRQNIYNVATITQTWGDSAKNLAEYQGLYSENMGRAVVLSESGYAAISQIARGTTLGAEGAADLAANMDKFGISVETSRDLVQETVNVAQKYGTNASVTTKKMLDNIKLATKLRFKGGIKDIEEISAKAAKFKMDISDIAGFAEKLFTPEGAIDAAAQLQVLGGEWSKMADPFKLMYQARHDMAGFQESIINSTKGIAQFNEQTKQFEISGMEMHRLREVAKATGIDYEKLANTALEFAKVSKIESKIGFKVDPEYKDFVTSIATFDKNGKIEFHLTDGSIIDDITKISKTELDKMVLQNESLKERAEEARSFDERWTDLVNTFKSLFLPALDGFVTGLRPIIDNFIGAIGGNSKFGESIKSLATSIGSFVGGIAKFAVESPKTAAAIALVGLGLWETAKWMTMGVSFGLGFNTVAGKSIGNIFNGGKNMFSGNANSVMGTTIKNGGSLSGNLLSKGLIGGGLIGGIVGGYNEYQENKDSGISTGKQIGKIGARATGAGIGTWVGGALGSLVLPGAGTIAGAALGGYLGDTIGDWSGDAIYGQNPKAHDFVARPGSKPLTFDSKDTVIGYKDGGPIDKAINGSNNGVSSNGTLNISFEPIKVEFSTLKLESGSGTHELDISHDPILARQLATVIQTELRKAIGGGVLNPNPQKS